MLSIWWDCLRNMTEDEVDIQREHKVVTEYSKSPAFVSYCLRITTQTKYSRPLPIVFNS